jgi:hypothetical protein
VTGDVERLLAEYLRTAAEWNPGFDRPRRANKLFDRNHLLYRQLRETSEGRDAIAGLLNDSRPGVRAVAAVHCLAWREAEAVAVLEALALEPGLVAIDAKYSLKAHREGTLDLDW